MKERTIYCPKCKYPNPSSRKTCYKCNADLYVEIVLDPPKPNNAPPATPPRVPPVASHNNQISHNQNNMGNFNNVFVGCNGDIILKENSIVIRRQGLLNSLLYGLKGEKEIFIKEISSVQFKEPGLLTVGYIQFVFKGGTEAHGAYTQAAWEDENSVSFTDTSRFQLLRNLLNERISELNSPQVTVSSGPAQEIEKLASLLERGLISKEEFEAGKRKILGL